MSRPPKTKPATVKEALASAAADAGIDVPFDVLENQAPYNFMPGAGPAGVKISVLDISEIILTLLFQLIQGSISGKGVLRQVAMRPEFYQTLSDEAQRFMIQQAAPEEPDNG